MILLQQFSKFNFDRSGALRVFAIPLSRRQSSNNDGQSDPDDGGLIVGVEEDVYHLFPFDRNYRDYRDDSVTVPLETSAVARPIMYADGDARESFIDGDNWVVPREWADAVAVPADLRVPLLEERAMSCSSAFWSAVRRFDLLSRCAREGCGIAFLMLVAVMIVLGAYQHIKI